MSERKSICVVTQPLTPASESAVDSLTDVLDAIATVSIITANLSEDSVLRERHDVTEISTKGTGDSIFTSSLRFILNQFKICRSIYNEGDSVILFFGTTSYILPILFSRLLNKTVILEPRGNVPVSLYHVWRDKYPDNLAYVASRIVWVLERIGYRVANRIITLSPSMAEDLELRQYHNKLYPDGAWHVNLDLFYSTTPYENRDQRIGYVGRLSEEKGIKELVPIVKQLSEEITFVFIGDGNLRAWVESELSDEIKNGGVEITGWIDHNEINQELSRLRLLILTSRTEGLPITIIEAMACGTPVYAKPVAGIPDIVSPGKTGYLMTDETATEAADRIEWMLNEMTDETSAQCRSVIENRYSFQPAVDRYRTALGCEN